MFNWLLKLLAHHGEPAPKDKDTEREINAIVEQTRANREARKLKAKQAVSRHRNFTDKEEQPWL